MESPSPSNGLKKKILVVAPCPFFIDRGTPIRIKRLAMSMSAEFEVHVAAFHQGRDDQFPFQIHRTLPLPLKIKRSGANLAKLLYDVLLVIKVVSLVRRKKIRVIDGHLHEGALIGLIAKLFTGAKVIYNAHGTFVPELIATGALKESSPLVRPLGSLETWIEKRSDRIIAQSRMRRDEFVAKGHPPEKVVVVEDVPELDEFNLDESMVDRVLQQRLRPNGEHLLIYSGGMEEYQGVDFLLAAFERLCRVRNDVRLVLFGRPIEDYVVMAQRMGLGDRVVFVDDEPFDRLPQYLKICDVGFALRLYGENVPGKLPIYMASGISVVGTDSKGINTVLTDGVNGVLVTPGDVDGLVAKISSLIDDPQMLHRLGQKGREEALKRYSQEDVKASLGTVYRDLLGIS